MLDPLTRQTLEGYAGKPMKSNRDYGHDDPVLIAKPPLAEARALGSLLGDQNNISLVERSALVLGLSATYLGGGHSTDHGALSAAKAALAKTPAAVKTRTLADLLAFSKAEPRENVLFGHETWEKSVITTGFEDPDYVKLKEAAQRTRGPEGIDKLLQATVHATEESIVNALIAAETMVGASGATVYALPHDRLREVLRKYGRLVQ